MARVKENIYEIFWPELAKAASFVKANPDEKDDKADYRVHIDGLMGYDRWGIPSQGFRPIPPLLSVGVDGEYSWEKMNLFQDQEKAFFSPVLVRVSPPS